jgi:hypothetical protein
MKVQPLSLEIPDNSGFDVTLKNTNRVFEYLTAQGWRCSRATVNRHAKAGKIPTNASGEYPLDGVNGYAAEHFEREGGEPLPGPALDLVAGTVVELSGEQGIEPAMNRLRAAEILAFQQWQANPTATAFRSYTQAVEALRKFERSFLDLQRERRELLPTTEVRAWMLRQIIASRTTLSNLPGKLAPQLEGHAWPKIQAKLEEEINNALSKLASDPVSMVVGGLEASGEPEPMAMGGGQP